MSLPDTCHPYLKKKLIAGSNHVGLLLVAQSSHHPTRRLENERLNSSAAIETTLTQDGTLTLDGLPFEAGHNEEIDVQRKLK